MLAEAYELRRNLDEVGFAVPANHPKLLSPGRESGYRVRLGAGGTIVSIDELDADEMRSLWNHIEGKQNAFPVFKIQHSLLASSNGGDVRQRIALSKSQDAACVSALREAIGCWARALLPKDEQTWQRLGEKADTWRGMFDEVPERFRAMPHMLERFGLLIGRLRPWLQELATRVVEELERGHLTNTRLAEKLLLGTDVKPGEPVRSGVPLALDVAEDDFPLRIGDQQMKHFVGKCLTEVDRNNGGRSKSLCAMSGKERVLLQGAFPEVQLPGLGNTKLFSKYDATPCEFRYIKSPSEWKDRSRSFPIGEEVAADIADGLRALVSPDLRGKTWRLIANGKWDGTGKNKREKRDLLIVYCEGQPVVSDEAADAFGDDERERQRQFESDAASLCRALDGIIKHRPKSRLHLLIIGKADKEKKQVLLHLAPTAAELLDAAERWRLAVRNNLPKISLPLPPENKGEKAIVGTPIPPYPDRVVRLLSSQWMRGGTDEQKLEGPRLRQVLDVMLRTPGRCRDATENLMHLTVQRTGPLLTGIAAAYGAGTDDQRKSYSVAAREAALRAVAVIGILLDALGRERKTYMNETAFRLGRLLAFADTLHREYCLHVRKGSIPPQLIGNALMPAAADNPEDAIDRLRERMSIYQAWATKSNGEEYRIAKWAVSQMGQICSAIERPLPTKTDTTFRAELFLGYLARPAKDDGNLPKETSHAE